LNEVACTARRGSLPSADCAPLTPLAGRRSWRSLWPPSRVTSNTIIEYEYRQYTPAEAGALQNQNDWSTDCAGHHRSGRCRSSYCGRCSLPHCVLRHGSALVVPLEPLLELEASVGIVEAERFLVAEPVGRGLHGCTQHCAGALSIPSGRAYPARPHARHVLSCEWEWPYPKKLVGRGERPRQRRLRNGASSHLAERTTLRCE
jgi:hypothetical protein